jgi:hypothetical protein
MAASEVTTMAEHQPVDVWIPYTGEWRSGFAIEGRSDDGFRLRRLSDGTVLPAPVPEDRVRWEGVRR